MYNYFWSIKFLFFGATQKALQLLFFSFFHFPSAVFAVFSRKFILCNCYFTTVDQNWSYQYDMPYAFNDCRIEHIVHK